MQHDESMIPVGHDTARAHQTAAADGVILPVPTAWPMVMALGVTLAITGMVTHWVISLLGVVLLLRSVVGWFFEVLPHENHVSVSVQPEEIAISSPRAIYTKVAADPKHRKLLPVETFKITAGIKGGIAGGVAMIVPATLFGLIRFHSVWYAVNLLAAGGFIRWAGQSDAFLAQFHLLGLLAGFGIHALTSVLVGLLYGALLPMFPRKPILTCGFIAPFLWTALLYSALGVISPIMNERIDWLWFVLSQVAFGLVCGFVVNLQVKVRTPQFRALPFAVRAGLHFDQSSGSSTPKDKDQ
ncbi:MAG: cytochrome c oxidase subunit 4 [Terracidiphilus sp.]